MAFDSFVSKLLSILLERVKGETKFNAHMLISYCYDLPTYELISHNSKRIPKKTNSLLKRLESYYRQQYGYQNSGIRQKKKTFNNQPSIPDKHYLITSNVSRYFILLLIVDPEDTIPTENIMDFQENGLDGYIDQFPNFKTLLSRIIHRLTNIESRIDDIPDLNMFEVTEIIMKSFRPDPPSITGLKPSITGLKFSIDQDDSQLDYQLPMFRMKFSNEYLIGLNLNNLQYLQDEPSYSSTMQELMDQGNVWENFRFVMDHQKSKWKIENNCIVIPKKLVLKLEFFTESIANIIDFNPDYYKLRNANRSIDQSENLIWNKYSKQEYIRYVLDNGPLDICGLIEIHRENEPVRYVFGKRAEGQIGYPGEYVPLPQSIFQPWGHYDVLKKLLKNDQEIFRWYMEINLDIKFQYMRELYEEVFGLPEHPDDFSKLHLKYIKDAYEENNQNLWDIYHKYLKWYLSRNPAMYDQDHQQFLLDLFEVVENKSEKGKLRLSNVFSITVLSPCVYIGVTLELYDPEFIDRFEKYINPNWENAPSTEDNMGIYFAAISKEEFIELIKRQTIRIHIGLMDIYHNLFEKIPIDNKFRSVDRSIPSP